MICPNCGAKIPDDKLYCEKCGAEFQIVPDYDVEVEGEIDKTLKNIGNNDYKDIEFDDLILKRHTNSTEMRCIFSR